MAAGRSGSGHPLAQALSPPAQGAGGCLPAYARTLDTSQCPPRYHLFPIDPKPFIGPIFVKDTTGCVAAVTADGSLSVHGIGPEVAPTELVELKLQPR